MADIEMVYFSGYCRGDQVEYGVWCHTDCAKDSGCPAYNDGSSAIITDKKTGMRVILSGECIRAELKQCYKGVSAKNYEIRKEYDPYVFGEHMIVRIGKKEYPCQKVVLNGECIYDNLPKE